MPTCTHRFRDYWSNRQNYRKNVLGENKDLDFPHKKNIVASELVVLDDITNENNVDVATTDGKSVASGLVNPSMLIQKYSLKSSKKPMFGHLEQYLPSMAALMIFLDFSVCFLYCLQANSYAYLLQIPNSSKHDIIMLNLSNRVSLALLLAAFLWVVLFILWESGLVKDIITSWGCALGLNSLGVIAVVYSGEVPVGIEYDDKPIVIALLGIIGVTLALGFIYWYEHQTYKPRAILASRLYSVFYLRIVIPAIPAVLLVTVGNVILPDSSYPLLVRDLSIFTLSGYLAVTLFMHQHPSLSLHQLSCYLYDSTQEESSAYRKNIDDRPWWICGQYWVLRHIYRWSWEITLPRPIRDFERIELWCNARTGKLEWIVSDFHFRELWHRVTDDFDSIIVDWDENFHTFDIDVQAELQSITQKIGKIESEKGLKGVRDLVGLYNTYLKKREEALKDFLSIHPHESLLPYLEDCGLAAKIIAKELSGRPWTYWRYAFGAYPPEKTRLWNRYAVTGDDYPASANQIR